MTKTDMKPIKFTYEKTITKKTGLNNSEIWEAGIRLDDWDYGYIVKGVWLDKINQDTFNDDLLRGVCSNKWYVVKDKIGNYWTIGMAYHA